MTEQRHSNTIDEALMGIAHAATQVAQSGSDDGTPIYEAVEFARGQILKLVRFSENDAVARHLEFSV